MEYGVGDCLRDLMRIRDSTASEDDETSLGFFLLSIIRDKGLHGVVALIQELDQTQLGEVEVRENTAEVIIDITRPGYRPLVVKAGDDGISPWVDVQIESDATSITPENPGHAAFYSIWERFVHGELNYTEVGAAKENAVYLIATLESQVMNGGFGQYLTNTDGLYLPETLECLEKIGALKTHALLMNAVKLANGFDSYVVAWDEKSEQYSRLDDEFYEIAEDLAGLTADAFIL
jgi:hypothetical protein